RIHSNPKQPRHIWAEGAANDLTESVRQHGVLQPILVTPTPEGHFEIIAGERRWRAALKAGLSTIPAVVRAAPENERFEMALIENIQREDLNPLDQAKGYARLANEFKMTQEQIAAAIGKDRTVVTNTLRLLTLPAPMQSALEAEKIS